MKDKKALFSTLVLSSLLAACGSGGGNDNPTPDTGGTGDTGGIGGDSGGTGNSVPLEITSSNAKDVASFATTFLDFGISSSGQAAQAKSGSASSQARAAFSFPCTSGGSSSIDGGDGDDQVEVGDYFQFTQNNCAEPEVDEDTGQNYIETTNGFFRLEISQVISENDLGFDYTMDETYTTNHGHSGSAKGGGSATFKLDGNGGLQANGTMQFTATFDGESISFNPLTYAFTQTGSQYTYDYNTTVSGSAIKGTISVATGPALTGTIDDEGEDNYPTGGKLTITGTNSSIVLDANTDDPDTVLMTIDENGTVTSETISWDELDSPQPLI